MYKLAVALTALCVTVVVANHSYARDDGRFANSPLKEWFDRLASRNGFFRAFADGVSVQDVDWDTQSLTRPEPNRFGPAVVWPYNDRYGNTQVRCFMPGAGT